MNILYFSHYSGIGGANKSLVDMCLQVREYGNQPYVVIPSKGEIERLLNKHSIDYAIFPYVNWICDETRNTASLIHKLKMLRRTIINRRVLSGLANWAREKSIEIIHTNDSLTIEGFLLSRKMKLPHVWHIREFLDDDYRLKFAYPDSYVTKCFRRSEAVISISKAISAKYASRIPDISLVYNGIFLPQEKRDKNKNEVLTITFAGGENPSKGIEDVLGAIRLLKEKNLPIQFVLAGSFSDERKSSINKEFDPSYCRCIGFTSDIYNLYEKSQIAIVASLKEAFGRVTAEAMLHRCAVIASNTGANVELINDGVTGVLYEQGSPEHLAAKIAELYMNQTLLNSIADNAAKHALNNYTMKAAVAKYVNIYHKLLDADA